MNSKLFPIKYLFVATGCISTIGLLADINLTEKLGSSLQGTYEFRTVFEQEVIDLLDGEQGIGVYSIGSTTSLDEVNVQIQIGQLSSGVSQILRIYDLDVGIGVGEETIELYFYQLNEATGEPYWEGISEIPIQLLKTHFSLGFKKVSDMKWQLLLEEQPLAIFEPFAIPSGSEVSVFAPENGKLSLYRIEWTESSEINNQAPDSDETTGDAVESGASELDVTRFESSARYGVPPSRPPEVGVIALPIDTKKLRNASPYKMSHEVKGKPVIHFKLTGKGNWKMDTSNKKIEKN